MRGARAKPNAGFMFNVLKQLMPLSAGASLAQKLYLDTKTESCWVSGSQLGVHLPVPLTLARRVGMGNDVPNMLKVYIFPWFVWYLMVNDSFPATAAENQDM